MTTIRSFRMTDLFNFNSIQLDQWTETFTPSYYAYYIFNHGTLCNVATTPHTNNTKLCGYMIGKIEHHNIKNNNNSNNKHNNNKQTQQQQQQQQYTNGHITALSIASEYRNIGLANILSTQLYNICNKLYNTEFIDLFVRLNNNKAQLLYSKLGYINYRKIMNYYGDNEHAYDMRLSCDKDKDKKYMIQHKPFEVQPEELQNS